MSCARCAPGCRCGDFSSKAAGLPSLVSIETVGDILSQAVKNTAGRKKAVAVGELSPEELPEKLSRQRMVVGVRCGYNL